MASGDSRSALGGCKTVSSGAQRGWSYSPSMVPLESFAGFFGLSSTERAWENNQAAYINCTMQVEEANADADD